MPSVEQRKLVKAGRVSLSVRALSRWLAIPVAVPAQLTSGDEKRGMRVPGAYAITVRYCWPSVPKKRLPSE